MKERDPHAKEDALPMGVVVRTGRKYWRSVLPNYLGCSDCYEWPRMVRSYRGFFRDRVYNEGATTR